MCTITQYVRLRYLVVQSFSTDVLDHPTSGDLGAARGLEPAPYFHLGGADGDTRQTKGRR
jgi:hypothetical protein